MGVHAILIEDDGTVSPFYSPLSATPEEIVASHEGLVLYDGELFEYNKWDEASQTVVEDEWEKYAREMEDWQEDRAEQVANIVVTTSAGHQFNGDEASQTRMTRALVGLADDGLIYWTLADNSITEVGKAELGEALYLAGTAQSQLWAQDKPEAPAEGV
jgi:hypothetical protein